MNGWDVRIPWVDDTANAASKKRHLLALWQLLAPVEGCLTYCLGSTDLLFMFHLEFIWATADGGILPWTTLTPTPAFSNV